MATTVKQSFETFISNINVTDRQESAVSTCRQGVVSAIDSELYLHSDSNSMLIGSWDRKTTIRPLKAGDVDLMVILHHGQHKTWLDDAGGAVKALDKFREILDKKYPYTTKRRDRNCISMSFSEFTFDVIPAFKNESGYYWIPDSVTNSWIQTNPIEFAKLITTANKNMNGTFVPIIKMFKAWNRNNTYRLKGFHLECLLYDHYKSYLQGYSYSSTVSVFLSGLQSKINLTCYDPVTYDRLDAYLDNQTSPTLRQNLYGVITSDVENAKKATEYEEKGDHESAIILWRRIFGDYFPSYG